MDSGFLVPSMLCIGLRRVMLKESIIVHVLGKTVFNGVMFDI